MPSEVPIGAGVRWRDEQSGAVRTGSVEVRYGRPARLIVRGDDGELYTLPESLVTGEAGDARVDRAAALHLAQAVLLGMPVIGPVSTQLRQLAQAVIEMEEERRCAG